MQYTKEIDKQLHFDVVVCGGGPSGILAALSAAREGVAVALVERYGFLGGSATAALVNPISEFRKNGRQVIGGYVWEFIERLASNEGAVLDYPSGNVPFNQELYKYTADQMLLEAGVTLLFGETLVDVVMKDAWSIDAIIVASRAGFTSIFGKCFIDATGDGDLASYTKVKFLPIDECKLQPATLYFMLSGVDVSLLENTEPKYENTRFYNKRIHDRLLELQKLGEDIPQFGGPWFCVRGIGQTLTVNFTRGNTSGKQGQIGELEVSLRRDVIRLYRILKKHFCEFENAELVCSGVQAGIRESRRIEGVYTMTVDDIVRHVSFSDTIALGAHPIDIHLPGSVEQDVTFLNVPFEIPYRVMIDASHSNYLAAGRIVSSDRQAFAALRVQATAMAIGEAAGVAASLACMEKLKVQDIPIDILIDTLRSHGAVLEV